MNINSHDTLDETVDGIQQTISGAQLPFQTGFRDLDGMVEFKSGDVIVIGSATGDGKTSFAMTIVENNLKLISAGAGLSNSAGLIFSFELSASDYLQRLICSSARIDQKRIRDRVVSKQDMTDIVAAIKFLRSTDCQLHVEDSRDITILDIRNKARELSGNTPFRYIMIDSLQFIRGTFDDFTRDQQISDLMREAKAMAKELGVPVFILSHLSRDCSKQSRPPVLTDLRDSGFIEAAADVVLLLSPSRSEQEGEFIETEHVDLIIAKNSKGRTYSLPFEFIKRYHRFEDPRHR